MEKEEDKKRNWGGPRAGAGRKKVRRRNFNFRATPEVEAILDALEGSKTDYINAAILQHSQNGGK